MFESLRRISRRVRRAGSDKYFLLMLVSFAISVSFTRAFLNLTGFPQLGSAGLHFAHVLWGGLVLFLASIIPLLFANRWVYPLGAILSGVGVGLFIDEVGKFITQTNNYFYPPAAPIIYGFFLLTVFLYSQVKRKPTKDARTELYHALDLLEEVLEHELDHEEKADLIASLERVRNTTTDEDYRNLAEELLHFLSSPKFNSGEKVLFISDHVNIFINRAKSRFISNRVLHYFCAVSLLLLGAYTMIYPFRIFLSTRTPADLVQFIQPLIQSQLVRSTVSMDWFAGRLALEASVGTLLIVSGVLLLVKKLVRGLSLAYFSLLLVFTTVDMLIFYYDQFSTIFFVTIQLIVFIAVTSYQARIKEMKVL
jgi:hypothetical protein